MISARHHSMVQVARRAEKPLVFKTTSFLPAVQAYADEVLRIFLQDQGADRFFDQLSFCLRELAVNAMKANIKRVYFRDLGLDLSDPGDYLRGMANFKTDTQAHHQQYLRLLKESGLYVKIEFLRSQGTCTLAVRNNSLPLAAEIGRVGDRVARAQSHSAVEEALGEVMDESEGAGLGLFFLVLMLKKVGFTGDFFRFYTVGGETVARIFLPQESTWPNSGRKTPPSTP